MRCRLPARLSSCLSFAAIPRNARRCSIVRGLSRMKLEQLTFMATEASRGHTSTDVHYTRSGVREGLRDGVPFAMSFMPWGMA